MTVLPQALSHSPALPQEQSTCLAGIAQLLRRPGSPKRHMDTESARIRFVSCCCQRRTLGQLQHADQNQKQWEKQAPEIDKASFMHQQNRAEQGAELPAPHSANQDIAVHC